MAHVYLRKDSDVYQCRVKGPDGWQRCSTKLKDQVAAQEFADQLEAGLQLRGRQGGISFSEAHEVYIKVAERSGKPLTDKTKRGYHFKYVVIRDTLGDFFLNELTPKDIEDYIRLRLKAGVKQATIRRDLSYLSSLYQWAGTLDDGPPTNPVKLLNRKKFDLQESAPRERWLTEEQFERLLELTPNPKHRDMMVLAVETGLRHDELLGLRWDEVDFRRNHLTLNSSRTKNGMSRIVPLTERARSALMTQCDTDPVYVFPSPRAEGPMQRVHGWWYALMKRAELTDFRFHDLRHTFASWASQRGMPERTLQLIMGHKSRAMTLRYAHLATEDLEKAMAIFERGQPANSIGSSVTIGT